MRENSRFECLANIRCKKENRAYSIKMVVLFQKTPNILKDVRSQSVEKPGYALSGNRVSRQTESCPQGQLFAFNDSAMVLFQMRSQIVGRLAEKREEHHVGGIGIPAGDRCGKHLEFRHADGELVRSPAFDRGPAARAHTARH